MKFIHISDLHIGKRVNEKPLIEDQAHILDRICTIVQEQKPDAVLIAGDVYDKAVPSGEAVLLFDDFLTRLASLTGHIFIISGNHDSAERMAFGARLMDDRGIHLSPVYDGSPEPVTLTDGYGEVDIYMLPYIRPVHVRHFLPEEEKEEVGTYDAAIRKAVERMGVDRSRRNVLMTHQFVTGAERSESEDISVGGTDNVDSSVFDPFDYVALGHIHKPQKVGRETIRYCGTPLKYSFSEANHTKSVTIVEFADKGQVTIRTADLHPKREMRHLKGAYDELTALRYYKDTTYQNDYLHITLTDEEDIPDAIGKLRSIYPYIMKLDYDNARTRANHTIDGAENAEQKTPLELFSEFYELQNNQPMSDRQRSFAADLMEKIWEGRQ